MSTLFSGSLWCSHDSDVTARAFAQFWHDTFVLNWLQTTDTGQLATPFAFTKTGVASTATGYCVYKMNDALQATVPIFVKMEWGAGAVANYHSIWCTIGKGSDGAGAITGVLKARFQLSFALNGGSSTQNVGSSGTGRITVGVGMSLGTNYSMYLGIERTVDSNGADTGVGIIVCQGRGLFAPKHHYIPYTGSIPAEQAGMHVVLAQEDPSTFATDIGISLAIPMAGASRQPGLNIAACRSADLAAYSTPSVPVYGASHVYFHCGGGVYNFRAQGLAAVGDTGIRLLLRYE